MAPGLAPSPIAAQMHVIEARLSMIAAEIVTTSHCRAEALDRCVHTAIDQTLDTEDFVTLVEEVERLSGWNLGPKRQPPLY